MTAQVNVEYNGLRGGHAYTFISCHVLSNGVRVFKIRNPHGKNEWQGAYADSDPYWASHPEDAALVGY